MRSDTTPTPARRHGRLQGGRNQTLAAVLIVCRLGGPAGREGPPALAKGSRGASEHTAELGLATERGGTCARLRGTAALLKSEREHREPSVPLGCCPSSRLRGWPQVNLCSDDRSNRAPLIGSVHRSPRQRGKRLQAPKTGTLDAACFGEFAASASRPARWACLGGLGARIKTANAVGERDAPPTLRRSLHPLSPCTDAQRRRPCLHAEAQALIRINASCLGVGRRRGKSGRKGLMLTGCPALARRGGAVGAPTASGKPSTASHKERPLTIVQVQVAKQVTGERTHGLAAVRGVQCGGGSRGTTGTACGGGGSLGSMAAGKWPPPWLSRQN